MIKLYHSPRTRSVRIYWLLEELGMPYQVVPIAFTPETLKSPEYLKVNPLGKVPSIQDGDLTMIEPALAGKSYLLGDEFSAADIMLGYALLLMKWFGLLGDATPNASAYLARLEQRPALQKALA